MFNSRIINEDNPLKYIISDREPRRDHNNLGNSNLNLINNRAEMNFSFLNNNNNNQRNNEIALNLHNDNREQHGRNVDGLKILLSFKKFPIIVTGSNSKYE